MEIPLCGTWLGLANTGILNINLYTKLNETYFKKISLSLRNVETKVTFLNGWLSLFNLTNMLNKNPLCLSKY